MSGGAVGRYLASRAGFLGLFGICGVVAYHIAVVRRGTGRTVTDSVGRAGPEADPAAVCERLGWPPQELEPVDLPLVPPLDLPGAFPAEGRLGQGALGLKALGEEFRNQATLLRRKAQILERLGTGYAIRARYYYALAGRLGDQPTRRARREAAQRPIGRHVLTKGQALARFAAAARLADRYYRRARGHIAQYLDMDRMLFEHAALLLYVGEEAEARRRLEELLRSYPDSRYTSHAKAYLALVDAARGRCDRAARLASSLPLKALGGLGGAVAAASAWCARKQGDPSRTLALSHKGLELLSQACKDVALCAPWLARALVVTVELYAWSAIRATRPAELVRDVRGLPGRIQAMVLSRAEALYRKAGMRREAARLCRVGAGIVEKVKARIRSEWKALLRRARQARSELPQDRRVALRGRVRRPASSAGIVTPHDRDGRGPRRVPGMGSRGAGNRATPGGASGANTR